MITFTKEQLIASAHARIEFADMMLAGELEPLKERTWSIELELARIALASLEAEAVCVIDQSNLDYLKSGSDADVWPASRTEMGDVLLYRAAPPAPVSVPDDVSGPLAHAYKELTPTFMRNHIDVFERYGIYPDGSAGIQAMRIALDGMNRRAAMLQVADGNSPAHSGCRPAQNFIPPAQCGNSPVIPECSCRTCRPVTISDMRFVVCPECGNKRCPHANDHRNACTGSNEQGQEGSAYPAALQQEVKQ